MIKDVLICLLIQEIKSARMPHDWARFVTGLYEVRDISYMILCMQIADYLLNLCLVNAGEEAILTTLQPKLTNEIYGKYTENRAILCWPVR
jgi:hypothetical protein